MRTAGLTRLRVFVFLGVWVVAQILVGMIYVQSKGGDSSPNLVPLVAAVGAPLGPMAGGVARFSESSCARFSWSALLWFLPFLLLAGFSLLVREGVVSRAARGVAVAFWGIGWFGWMVGAVASLGYGLG